MRNIAPPDCSDWPEMLEIYNACVTGSDCTFDWQPKTLEAFKAKLSFSENWPRVVVGRESGGREVFGWASNLPWSQKLGFADVGEVSIYVREDQAGQGWGGILLDDLIARAEAVGMFALIAFVTEQNTASEGLLQNRGFVRTGVFPKLGSKFDRRFDLNIFQRFLSKPA